MLHRFFGGLSLEGRRAATASLPSIPMAAAPARVALAAEAPAVAVGDRVRVGDRLSLEQGSRAAVYASVSGTVAAIEPRVQVDGREALCVVIENDGLDTPAPLGVRAPAETPPHLLEADRVRAAVAWAGIAGMGGTAFPTGAKLSATRGKVHTLILNGCEGEPYLTADRRLMLERAPDVLAGARLLALALGLKSATIAVEGNQYDAAAALRALLPKEGGDVEIVILPPRYPQGEERQLIRRLTGREVPAGGFPLDLGLAVFNVATAAAVTDAVYGGIPLTHRIVTVTGGAVRSPKNLLVPLGTPVSDLLREAGGLSGRAERVMAGGPMMGHAQLDLDAPIHQGVGAVVAMMRREVGAASAPEGPCLRCGKCADVCPMRLEPAYLRLHALAGRARALERYHMNDCMECGTCAYVCPARIKLIEYLRRGKALLREGEDHG